MAPYGNVDLGQHWLRWWLVAWWHQAITWTSVDYWSVRPHGIHLRAISQEMLKIAIRAVSLKITNWRLHHQSLRWRHNGCDSVSNHQPRDSLLSRLFRHRSKKTWKLRVTGLCVGNSPGTVNSPHKRPVTRKMFPFDNVIMMPRAQWVKGPSQDVIIWHKLSWFHY